MIIINADDFGMSRQVNRAIVTCFHEGVISSATIMVNMPAFEDACRVAINNKMGKHIGIHLNITEGRPISNKILEEPKFCNKNGEFCFQRNKAFFLTRNEKETLSEEIEAQIKHCLDMDLSLTHLDSHHHVHTEWSVFEVIRPLIRKYGIKYVRPARNDNQENSIPVRSYKALFNRRLAYLGLRKTLYFGDLEGFRAMRVGGKRGLRSFEVMVHPTLHKNGTIVDKTDDTEIIPITRNLIKGLKLSSFA